MAQALASALLREWHPTKNGTLDPAKVSAGSGRAIWWLGACGHEWQAQPQNRKNGQGCSVCAGKQILAGFNDLASQAPAAAELWHPTKNGKLTATAVARGSNKPAWWLCPQGHEWQAVPYLLARQQDTTSRGCPFCAGQRAIPGVDDLATMRPELAAEWHSERNGELLASALLPGSNQKVWWLGSCSHEWQATVNNRAKAHRPTGCPICSGRALIPGVNDLASQAPTVAAEWHPTKNGELKAAEVHAHSNQQVWWLDVHGHAWQAMVNNRTKPKPTGCPICNGTSHVEVGANDLASQAPALAEQWHPTKNGELAPTSVRFGSDQVVWWLGLCGHEWQSKIGPRVNGNGCPVCRGLTVLPGVNDFATARPSLVPEWHPTRNRDLLPSQVPVYGGQKVWWLCEKGHEWESWIYQRSYGHGCARCANVGTSRMEQALADYVESLGVEIERQWRKTPGVHEMDIYVPSLKLGIEFNGVFWHSDAMGRGKDYHRQKWAAAQAAGVQLIQVWEDDWRDRPLVVQAMLRHKLGLSAGVRVGARKTQIVDVPLAEARTFMAGNHIQGFTNGSSYVGLRLPDGTLVALMILLRRAGAQVEIVRYATAQSVAGGFTRLLREAERRYPGRTLVTFSDHTVSDGGLYAAHGFTRDGELAPDYSYLVAGSRQHKFGYRLKRFRTDPVLEWREGLSERELAQLNGLHRVWDAGKTRWVAQQTGPRPIIGVR